MPSYLVEFEDGRKFRVESKKPLTTEEVTAYALKQAEKPESMSRLGTSVELAAVTPANANSTAGKVASSLGIAVCCIVFLLFLCGTHLRKKIVLSLLGILCLFVAGYCFLAATASGGWHLNREGEPSYTRPSHYSGDFYEGLRWSVMIVSILMAITLRNSKERESRLFYGIIAVLFNPIVPIHLYKTLWQIIDVAVGFIFMGSLSTLRDIWPTFGERGSQTLKNLPASEKKEEKAHTTDSQQKAKERAERLEREARENERKAKADAAEAEERRFIGEVNALLGTCPEHDTKLPSRNVLLCVSSDMGKVLPKLVVAGMVELAERVKNSKARIDELLKTHEEHSAALEKGKALLAGNKTAPIIKMMETLRGRFEELDYTPFQDRIDKAQQRFFKVLGFVCLVIVGFLIGFGMHKSMMVAQQGAADAKESIASSSVKDSGSDGLEKEPNEGAAYARALLGGTLEKDIVKTPPVQLPVEPPSDPFASTMPPPAAPMEEAKVVKKIEPPPPVAPVVATRQKVDLSGWTPPPYQSIIDESASNALPENFYRLRKSVKVIGIKSDDTLAVRSGPSTRDQKVAELPFNARGIKLTGPCEYKQGTWFPIVWENIEGWVNGSYLDFE